MGNTEEGDRMKYQILIRCFGWLFFVTFWVSLFSTDWSKATLEDSVTAMAILLVAAIMMR